ncbi:MAG TPA: hypothetical protein VGG71_00445 [Chitinophagaceae bacterium]|jgi:hypothetical protein
MYHSNQPDLTGFSEWLDEFTSTAPFQKLAGEYIDIHRRLLNEHDAETRHFLVSRARQIRGSKPAQE